MLRQKREMDHPAEGGSGGSADPGTSVQTGQRVELHHLPDYSIHPALKHSLVLPSIIGNIRNMLK